MRVLSLFDGIACGYEALQRAGIKVDAYYSSEIDKYAIQIAQKNHPDIVQLGDVNDWESWNLEGIDMIIGGSPCQGFSMAGKMLNFNDPRSALFFKFVDIVKHYRPKYFLLENVKMKKEFQEVITGYMGVEPIEINSALVSAQNRKRLYRTNIPGVIQPEDKRILLKDVLETDVDEKYYYDNERWQRILNGKYDIVKRLEDINNKCATLTTVGGGNHEKKISVQGAAIRNQHTKNGVETQLNIRKDEKSNCVVGSYADKLNLCTGKVIRKLTPVECERLQTMPDNYTAGVSNTQRYKALGNGWTVNVIAHIFSFIK